MKSSKNSSSSTSSSSSSSSSSSTKTSSSSSSSSKQHNHSNHNNSKQQPQEEHCNSCKKNNNNNNRNGSHNNGSNSSSSSRNSGGTNNYNLTLGALLDWSILRSFQLLHLSYDDGFKSLMNSLIEIHTKLQAINDHISDQKDDINLLLSVYYVNNNNSNNNNNNNNSNQKSTTTTIITKNNRQSSSSSSPNTTSSSNIVINKNNQEVLSKKFDTLKQSIVKYELEYQSLFEEENTLNEKISLFIKNKFEMKKNEISNPFILDELRDAYLSIMDTQKRTAYINATHQKNNIHQQKLDSMTFSNNLVDDGSLLATTSTSIDSSSLSSSPSTSSSSSTTTSSSFVDQLMRSNQASDKYLLNDNSTTISPQSPLSFYSLLNIPSKSFIFTQSFNVNNKPPEQCTQPYIEKIIQPPTTNDQHVQQQVLLKWSCVSEVQEYCLEMKRKDTQEQQPFTVIYRGHNCFYTSPPLDLNQTLSFRVRATNRFGIGSYSEELEYKTSTEHSGTIITTTTTNNNNTIIENEEQMENQTHNTSHQPTTINLSSNSSEQSNIDQQQQHQQQQQQQQKIKQQQKERERLKKEQEQREKQEQQKKQDEKEKFKKREELVVECTTYLNHLPSTMSMVQYEESLNKLTSYINRLHSSSKMTFNFEDEDRLSASDLQINSAITRVEKSIVDIKGILDAYKEQCDWRQNIKKVLVDYFGVSKTATESVLQGHLDGIKSLIEKLTPQTPDDIISIIQQNVLQTLKKKLQVNDTIVYSRISIFITYIFLPSQQTNNDDNNENTTSSSSSSSLPIESPFSKDFLIELDNILKQLLLKSSSKKKKQQQPSSSPSPSPSPSLSLPLPTINNENKQPTTNQTPSTPKKESLNSKDNGNKKTTTKLQIKTTNFNIIRADQESKKSSAPPSSSSLSPQQQQMVSPQPPPLSSHSTSPQPLTPTIQQLNISQQPPISPRPITNPVIPTSMMNPILHSPRSNQSTFLSPRGKEYPTNPNQIIAPPQSTSFSISQPLPSPTTTTTPTLFPPISPPQTIQSPSIFNHSQNSYTLQFANQYPHLKQHDTFLNNLFQTFPTFSGGIGSGETIGSSHNNYEQDAAHISVPKETKSKMAPELIVSPPKSKPPADHFLQQTQQQTQQQQPQQESQLNLQFQNDDPPIINHHSPFQWSWVGFPPILNHLTNPILQPSHYQTQSTITTTTTTTTTTFPLHNDSRHVMFSPPHSTSVTSSSSSSSPPIPPSPMSLFSTPPPTSSSTSPPSTNQNYTNNNLTPKKPTNNSDSYTSSLFYNSDGTLPSGSTISSNFNHILQLSSSINQPVNSSSPSSSSLSSLPNL